MERKPSTHSPESICRDIDLVLLAEAQLLEALKDAVRFNALEPYEAEEVIWDFRNAHNLTADVRETDVPS